MAVFEYSALTSAGRLMKGTIEATSYQQASQLLKQMQLTVNSIELVKPKKPKTAIGRNEFMLFNQQLISLTKAGIPLEKGLRELASDITSKSMRKLINDIASELEAGVSIEQAFEKRQKAFPPLYSQVLKAGVQTGRLSEMLTTLNRHLDMANRTRRIIFEAVTYPLVVLTWAAIIITAFFVVVVPRFKPIYADMLEGEELPFLTSFFLNIAKNIVSFWMIIALIIVGIIFISVVLSSFPAGRRFKESLLLKVPVMGRLYHNSILGRFAFALATMISAGTDMPTALRLSANATGSEKMTLESDMLAKQIEKGANILEAGQFCTVIPRLFLYSIQLGSQRNELQDNLYTLGEMYAEQLQCGQARLQALLLPIMLIIVGGFIAITIVAMFLPMIRILLHLGRL